VGWDWSINAQLWLYQNANELGWPSVDLTLLEIDTTTVDVVAWAVAGAAVGTIVGLVGGVPGAVGGFVVGLGISLVTGLNGNDDLGSGQVTPRVDGSATVQLRGDDGGADVSLFFKGVPPPYAGMSSFAVSATPQSLLMGQSTLAGSESASLAELPPDERAYLIFSKLQEMATLARNIDVEPGNPGEITPAQLEAIRNTYLDATVQMGAIVAGFVVDNPLTAGTTTNAMALFTEGQQLAATGNVEGALHAYEAAFVEAETARQEGVPPEGRLPFQVTLGLKTITANPKTDVRLAATVVGAQGQVSLTVSNLPPEAAVQIEQPAADQAAFFISLNLGSVRPGTYPLWVTATDGSQEVSEEFTLVVNATSGMPPEARCKDVTVPVGANCSATASIDAGSSDPDGDAITFTQNPVGPYPLGKTTVTLTVSDSNGNSASCTATVTVVDTTPPTITAPGAVMVNTDVGKCSASGVVLETPFVSDNCSVASVVNNAPAIFQKGVTMVTWTVTDNSANTATATQTVTVNDNEPPTIALVDRVIVSDRAACDVEDHDDDNWAHHEREGRHRDQKEDHSQCKQNHRPGDEGGHGYTCKFANRCVASGVVLTEPVVADNCGIASVTNDHPSTIYPIGVTQVTWTVTDTSGNISIRVQKVTVIASVEVEFDAPAVRKPARNTIHRGQVVPLKAELVNCLNQLVWGGVTVYVRVQGVDGSTREVFQDVIEKSSGVGRDGTFTSDGVMQLRDGKWQFNLDTSNFDDPDTIGSSRSYRATVSVIDNATLAVVGMGRLNLETGKAIERSNTYNHSR
jgi:hypothetical protein